MRRDLARVNLTALTLFATAALAGCVADDDDSLASRPFDELRLAEELEPDSYASVHDQMRRSKARECGCAYRESDLDWLELDAVLAAVEEGDLIFDSECAARILASHDDVQCEPPSRPSCWAFKGEKREGEACSFPTTWVSNCGDEMLCMVTPDSAETGVCRKFVELGEECVIEGASAPCREGSCVDGVCVPGQGIGEVCDAERFCASGSTCIRTGAEPYPGICEEVACDLTISPTGA